MLRHCGIGRCFERWDESITMDPGGERAPNKCLGCSHAHLTKSLPHPQLEPQAEERGGVSPLLMAHLPQGGYY